MSLNDQLGLDENAADLRNVFDEPAQAQQAGSPKEQDTQVIAPSDVQTQKDKEPSPKGVSKTLAIVAFCILGVLLFLLYYFLQHQKIKQYYVLESKFVKLSSLESWYI